MLDEKEIEKKIKKIKKINPAVYPVSIHDQEKLEKIKKEMLAMLKK